MDLNSVQEELEHFEEQFDEETTKLPKVALEIPVSQLHMRNRSTTLSPDTSIRDVIDKMLGANVGCLPVTEGSRLVGIVTERDILMKVAPDFTDVEHRPVRDIMIAEPTFVRSDAPVAAAIRLMHEGHYRHLPVIDAEGRVTGVVSVRNIMEYIVEHFPEEVLNLPPHPVERKPTLSPEGA